jgi:hypothetical protein
MAQVVIRAGCRENHTFKLKVEEKELLNIPRQKTIIFHIL